MPDIADFQTGNQGEGLGPICTGVAGDAGFLVALGSLILQIAGLGRSAAVEPGPIPPLRIQLNAVRWISHQQQRLPLPQKPGYSFGIGRIPAKYAVRTTKPQIAW